MDNDTVKVLLVEDDEGEVKKIKELLAEAKNPSFEAEQCHQISDIFERLQTENFNALLLDISSSSASLESIRMVQSQAPNIPMIVLADEADERQAIGAGKIGAEDYLLKSYLTPELLSRSLRYAIDRKQAERSCLHTQLFLNSIIENIPNMIFVKDAAELRFVRFNKAGEELLGYSRNELVGRNDYDFFPKQEADFFISKDREVLKGKKLVEIPEEPIQTRYKGARFLHTKKIPILDEKGEPQYLLGISEDITERKKAQEALQKAYDELEKRVEERTAELSRANEDLKRENLERERAEQKFKNLVETAPDAIVIVDESGKIVLINSQAEEMFGYDRDELIGKPVEILIPKRYHKRHVEHRKEYMEELQPRTTGVGQQLYAMRKDDSEFPVENRLSPLQTEEGILVSASVRDVSERIEAEQELRKLSLAIEQSGSAVMITDSKGNIEYVNPKFSKLSGYDLEEVKGKNPRFLKSGETSPEVYEHLWQTISSGNEWRGELHNKKKNGELYWVAASISPLRDEHGDITHFISNQEDITQRKHDEEALRWQAHNLKRSNTELEQFAYVASHDLREPLRMVGSYLQLLQRRYKDRLDDTAREFIAFATDGATRMQQLIDDLLMYSRVGTHDQAFENVDCVEVFDSAVTNLKVAISESKAVVTHDSLPTVRADAVQITQVFQNLISNAIHYCKVKPRIHISAEETNQEWIFLVRDNGIGIKPQQTRRVFVIFQRLHPKRNHSGSGLGLALCKKIVERHGGRIWVESKPGKGSVFYFTISKTRQGKDKMNDQQRSRINAS